MNHRVATPSDAPLLAELNHQLIADEGHRNRMNVPELERRMRRWLETQEYVATIFEEGGELVAYALHQEQPSAVYLRQFFVARQRRRQGIGRRAMRALLGEVWPGNRRLLLEVLCGNLAAIAFYRALGYADYSLAMEMVPSRAGEL